jgi:hypothetical protein
MPTTVPHRPGCGAFGPVSCRFLIAKINATLSEKLPGSGAWKISLPLT